MFISPAFAQAAGAPEGPGFLIQLLPFVFIFAIMYFLIIRPQQKRAKEHREMLGALRRGDEVITQGGILGKITRVKEGDQEVEVEIGKAGAEPVRARIIKDTIASVLSKTEPVSGGGKPDKSDKPANANKPPEDKKSGDGA